MRNTPPEAPLAPLPTDGASSALASVGDVRLYSAAEIDQLRKFAQEPTPRSPRIAAASPRARDKSDSKPVKKRELSVRDWWPVPLFALGPAVQPTKNTLTKVSASVPAEASSTVAATTVTANNNMSESALAADASSEAAAAAAAAALAKKKAAKRAAKRAVKDAAKQAVAFSAVQTGELNCQSMYLTLCD